MILSCSIAFLNVTVKVLRSETGTRQRSLQDAIIQDEMVNTIGTGISCDDTEDETGVDSTGQQCLSVSQQCLYVLTTITAAVNTGLDPTSAVATIETNIQTGVFAHTLAMDQDICVTVILPPSEEPSSFPSSSPSTSIEPSVVPTGTPSAVPSLEPSSLPSAVPSLEPSSSPSAVPSSSSAPSTSASPSHIPTTSNAPTISAVPSSIPSDLPSADPSSVPSLFPTGTPSTIPSSLPSAVPVPFQVFYKVMFLVTSLVSV